MTTDIGDNIYLNEMNEKCLGLLIGHDSFHDYAGGAVREKKKYGPNTFLLFLKEEIWGVERCLKKVEKSFPKEGKG